MRYAPVLSLLLAAALTVPATAQEWSPQQQEVIEFAHGCWTSWATESWSAYQQACPMDPGARYWDFTESVPTYGHESWKRWNDAMWPRMDALYYEHRPIAVQIFGDVATYYFFAVFGNTDSNGVVREFTQHEVAVLQRRNGNWILIGGAYEAFPKG